MMSKKAKKKLNKGKDYLQHQDFIKAIKCFKEGLKLAPDSAELWLSLGSSFLSNNKFRGAIRCFKKVIKLTPVDYIVFKLLAESYAKIGEFDEARNFYEKFLEFNPNDKKGKEKLQKITVIQNKMKKILNPIYLKRISQNKNRKCIEKTTEIRSSDRKLYNYCRNY
ncbi:MAG: tetratricopeptide repeat protein [Patescibacteria group bacterium]|nr:tetratricopeptide repeat protein [Patescibacteria group bacterium]